MLKEQTITLKSKLEYNACIVNMQEWSMYIGHYWNNDKRNCTPMNKLTVPENKEKNGKKTKGRRRGTLNERKKERRVQMIMNLGNKNKLGRQKWNT